MNMVDSRHSIKVDPFERADAVLSVSDLRAGYGTVPVLHGVNLHIREGEAVGIVGHNGMGKTTFLKVVMGLMPATGGRIELDGMDATGTAAHMRSQMGIGYVPQGRGILPGLTAYENLRMAWREDILKEAKETLQHLQDENQNHPDLADRAVFLTLEPIPEESRRPARGRNRRRLHHVRQPRYSRRPVLPEHGAQQSRGAAGRWRCSRRNGR